VKIALITTDNRAHYHEYGATTPNFGTAPEALLEGFAQLEEIEVHVVSCTRVAMQSPERLAPNIYFHSVRVPKIGWMRTLFSGCVRAIRAKLKEIRPDIVHGQGTEEYCSISAVLSGWPNVLTIHGNMSPLAKMFRAPIGSYSWLAARLENFVLRRSAGVFCNSEYTEQLVKPRSRRTWRVPNAIRAEFFDSPMNMRRTVRPVFVNVGVISKRKRQNELLNVVRHLRSLGIDCEFQFAGRADPANSYAATFLETIRPMEREGIARFVGPLDTKELIQLFDTASAIIHFPSEEAFGLVVAEALSRNLKLFGSRVGGIVDIASDVPGAELFEAEDWSGLLESIVNWAKGGFSQPAGMSTVTRAVERFHPQAIAKKHFEIYEDVLSKSS